MTTVVSFAAHAGLSRTRSDISHVMRFLTEYDTNQAGQSQKMARGLKFRI